VPILVPYTFCSNWSDAPPPKTCITAHTRQRVPVVLARVSSAQNQGRASVSAARRRHARHRRPPQAARAACLNLSAPYSRANPYRRRNRRDENVSIRSRRNVSARTAAALRASTIIDIRLFSPNQCTCCRNERTCSRNPLEAKPRDKMRELIAVLGGLDAARRRPPNTVGSAAIGRQFAKFVLC